MQSQDRKFSSGKSKKIFREFRRAFLVFIGALIVGCIVSSMIDTIRYEYFSGDNILTYPDYEETQWYKLSSSDNQEFLLSETDSISSAFSERDFSLIESAQQSFSEQEFIKISETLLDKSSNVPLNDWQVKDVNYHLYDCEKGFSGYVYTEYSYEYPVSRGDYVGVSGHKQELYPGSNYVGDSSYSYAMHVIENKYYAVFDESYPISATEAYEIIEEKGGYEARSKQDNHYCEAVIALDYKDNQKWHIWYTGKHGIMFEGLVDRESGKFRKIRVKK